jgi:uncharacterized protein YaeQ
MALKARIFKADIQISDMDRHYYQNHSLVLAQHPSETEERVMMRLFAFARHAHEALVFTKGMFDADEPDLWQKDLTGVIKLWIDVGQPDERRILKACGRSEQVYVYSYANHSHIWWNQISSKLNRAKNLTVINIMEASRKQLTQLAQRSMQLQCTIQDGQMWLSDGVETVQMDVEVLM